MHWTVLVVLEVRSVPTDSLAIYARNRFFPAITTLKCNGFLLYMINGHCFWNMHLSNGGCHGPPATKNHHC